MATVVATTPSSTQSTTEAQVDILFDLTAGLDRLRYGAPNEQVQLEIDQRGGLLFSLTEIDAMMAEILVPSDKRLRVLPSKRRLQGHWQPVQFKAGARDPFSTRIKHIAVVHIDLAHKPTLIIHIIEGEQSGGPLLFIRNGFAYISNRPWTTITRGEHSVSGFEAGAERIIDTGFGARDIPAGFRMIG